MTPQQLAHSITVLFRGEKSETIEKALTIVIKEQQSFHNQSNYHK